MNCVLSDITEAPRRYVSPTAPPARSQAAAGSGTPDGEIRWSCANSKQEIQTQLPPACRYFADGLSVFRDFFRGEIRAVTAKSPFILRNRSLRVLKETSGFPVGDNNGASQLVVFHCLSILRK